MTFALRAAALIVAATLTTAANAASPIDGTWKADVGKAKLPTRPNAYLLKDGSYACDSCVPAYKVAADGQFHAVPGYDYWDETAVTVVDANTATFSYRQKGKETSKETVTVSPDGKTATSQFTETGANGAPISGTGIETRLTAAPAGAHPISGSWKRAGVQDVSDSGTVVTMMEMGGGLHLTLPTGESYMATYGGPAVPMQGDKGGTMVAVRKSGALTWVETGTRAGKPAYEMVMTVSADGRTMDVVSTSKRTNAITTYKAYKQ